MELYYVPVYKVLIEGTNAKGAKVKKEWPALRFMPYWNDPKKPDPHYSTRGWVNAGLHQLPKKKVTFYNPNYGTQNRYSPYSGAIQMRDSFLIHAGPRNLSEEAWGSAGCVEIIGNFNDFKQDIADLSGSISKDAGGAISELVKAGKLFVRVDYARPPDIKKNFAGELP
ncbi:hypothetical protein [Candidatus Thiosymbion oneisti]|uniref:hypothetical protein n=1 Tax=Candidatus Thiosymbion oneisti TaxID=589554 RepID=UPI001A9C9FDB|nr:hypothetical protein [Candidatus Thiosymbion oneisti]